MTPDKSRKPISIGNIISAVVFIVLMVAMVLFAMAYDPGEQFSSSFFEDVANAIQWKQ